MPCARDRGLAALFADIDDAFGMLDVLVSKPMSLSRGAILMLPSHDGPVGVGKLLDASGLRSELLQ